MIEHILREIRKEREADWNLAFVLQSSNLLHNLRLARRLVGSSSRERNREVARQAILHAREEHLLPRMEKLRGELRRLEAAELRLLRLLALAEK